MPKKTAHKRSRQAPSEEGEVVDSEASEDERAPHTLTKEEWMQRYPSASSKTVKRFWIGVIGFAAVISITWGISIKLQMQALKNRQTEESELIAKTKSEWDAIFNDKQTKESKQSIKSALDQVMNALAKQTTEPATTTTSTAFDVATTTPETTSTLK